MSCRRFFTFGNRRYYHNVSSVREFAGAMLWSRVFGLVAYVSVVQSSRQTTTTSSTTSRAASCGLTQWRDVESQTVAASLVVDAVVTNLRRVHMTSTSGDVLYQVRFTVIHVLKGQLERPARRPRRRRRRGGRVTISVGTFVRATSRPTSYVDEELCASRGLPVNGSRYIVFLQQPAPASPGRPFIYSISSSPQPFSVNKLNLIRSYSRQKYGIYFFIFFYTKM